MQHLSAVPPLRRYRGPKARSTDRETCEVDGDGIGGNGQAGSIRGAREGKIIHECYEPGLSIV